MSNCRSERERRKVRKSPQITSSNNPFLQSLSFLLSYPFLFISSASAPPPPPPPPLPQWQPQQAEQERTWLFRETCGQYRRQRESQKVQLYTLGHFANALAPLRRRTTTTLDPFYDLSALPQVTKSPAQWRKRKREREREKEADTDKDNPPSSSISRQIFIFIFFSPSFLFPFPLALLFICVRVVLSFFPLGISGKWGASVSYMSAPHRQI